MTLMPKDPKNPKEACLLMTKTQPNGIIGYIFGFSVKRSTKLAWSRLEQVNLKKVKKSPQFLSEKKYTVADIIPEVRTTKK